MSNRWIGPHKDAEEALEATRRGCAEVIGADPETWPDHGNAPLAIVACVAIANARRSDTQLALTDRQVHIMRGLMRSALRKRLKDLRRIKRFPEQSEDNFNAVKASVEASIYRYRELLTMLGGNPDNLE